MCECCLNASALNFSSLGTLGMEHLHWAQGSICHYHHCVPVPTSSPTPVTSLPSRHSLPSLSACMQWTLSHNHEMQKLPELSMKAFWGDFAYFCSKQLRIPCCPMGSPLPVAQPLPLCIFSLLDVLHCLNFYTQSCSEQCIFSLPCLAGWGGICAFHDPSLSAACLLSPQLHAAGARAAQHPLMGPMVLCRTILQPSILGTKPTQRVIGMDGWRNEPCLDALRGGWGDKPGSCGRCRCRGGLAPQSRDSIGHKFLFQRFPLLLNAFPFFC